ncbi:MAG TPA: prephenate dehydrogenase/arogenate dehydrogenase family protein [Oligoflexia bacterium]|nr:prephenate dehydrogenase/arogenate dehydrogenase family protein [Oligoflexia bacterium]HMP48345.1 prephenate dehydrogenase/arogenate dehydrogenase family protein [Oligoflexia bacterium]
MTPRPINTDNNPSKLLIGTLGPTHSYSEEGALRVFPHENIILKSTISETLRALKDNLIEIAVVPIENALNGPVTETWDELTSINISNNENKKSDPCDDSLEIISSFLLPIDHWLGLPAEQINENNQLINKIDVIFSHEQALQQSGPFLSSKFSEARLVKTSSTSESPIAARAHSKKSNEIAAAIASKTALIKNDFHPITRTTEGSSKNQTRFAVISKSINKSTAYSLFPQLKPAKSRVTAIAIHPGKDRKGILLEILSVISEKYGCNLVSIHSRPDTTGGFIFYFEIEGSREDNKISDCLEDLTRYCRNNTGSSAKLLYFGSFERAYFNTGKLLKACIVGANGAMGKWLSDFLLSSGLDVLTIDKFSDEINSENNIKQEIKSCDLVIFSVPMSSIKEVIKEFSPYISENALIVENCSVKSNALSILESAFTGSFETLGIHTMFGPDTSTSDLKGRNVIICKTGNSGERAIELENLFYKFGANIHYSHIEEHDRIASLLQALCQFASLGLGQVFSEHNISGETLSAFLTPNSERILTSINRVISQSSTLTFDLQNENPYSEEIRNALISALQTISKDIKSPDQLERRINSLRNSLLKE